MKSKSGQELAEEKAHDVMPQHTTQIRKGLRSVKIQFTSPATCQKQKQQEGPMLVACWLLPFGYTAVNPQRWKQSQSGKAQRWDGGVGRTSQAPTAWSGQTCQCKAEASGWWRFTCGVPWPFPALGKRNRHRKSIFRGGQSIVLVPSLGPPVRRCLSTSTLHTIAPALHRKHRQCRDSFIQRAQV